MNTYCEDGQHYLGSNATVDMVGGKPLSVTFSPVYFDVARSLTIEQLTTAIEAYIPAWIVPVGDSDFSSNLPDGRTASITLLPNQPTHVRQVWWLQGTTYEGHPTHALEQIAVRIVNGIALDRDDVAVQHPRDGAQCRFVPIAQESP